MRHFATVIALLLASPSQAEVKSVTSAGFEVSHMIIVPVPPEQSYQRLLQINRWWNSEHSYSGDAANLRLEGRAGGCFCEVLPDSGGSVEHGRVVHARPGVTLRLQGGLGPLQGEGVSGALTWELRAVPGGTQVTQNYVVGGYIRGGANKMASGVDVVLSEQLNRFGASFQQ